MAVILGSAGERSPWLSLRAGATRGTVRLPPQPSLAVSRDLPAFSAGVAGFLWASSFHFHAGRGYSGVS